MGIRQAITAAGSAFARTLLDPPAKAILNPQPVATPRIEGSIQPRLDPTLPVEGGHTAFWYINRFASYADNTPPWGDPTRDAYLRTVWKDEPILAGALYAMTVRISSLGWTLTGGRNLVREYYEIMQEANGGAGWAPFLAEACLDFLTCDRGMFIELGKSEVGGYTTGLFNLDSARCFPTGHAVYPVIYRAMTGETYQLRYDEVHRAVSMPTSDERYKGLGTCAVSRALRSAKLLMKLYEYKEEKLDDLPPQGIAKITGLTPEQVDQAFRKYAAERQNHGNLTFPGILWLIGNDIGANIDVEFIPFASLPDNYDDKTAVDIYAKTLAVSFGVDVAEIWQIENTGASRAATWVQALKAKGKGPGELSAIFARMLNTYVLPRNIKFQFESFDIEDEKRAAEIKRDYARFVRTLSATQQQTGIITRDEARRILAEAGCIPMDMVSLEYDTMTDVGAKANDPYIRKYPDGDELVLFNPLHPLTITEVKHELSVDDDGVVNIWLRQEQPKLLAPPREAVLQNVGTLLTSAEDS